MSCCRSIISSRELPKSDGVTMAFLACVISSTVGLRRPWGQRRTQCSCGLRGLLMCVPPRCPPGSPLQQQSSGSARAKIRRAQLIHLQRSTEAAACWREAALESLRCFCRDLYVVTTPAALGLRQLSCASVAEEGAGPSLSLGCGEAGRGHVYSSPGTRQTLGHGTAEKQPWEKRIPDMLKPRAWL